MTTNVSLSQYMCCNPAMFMECDLHDFVRFSHFFNQHKIVPGVSIVLVPSGSDTVKPQFRGTVGQRNPVGMHQPLTPKQLQVLHNWATASGSYIDQFNAIEDIHTIYGIQLTAWEGGDLFD